MSQDRERDALRSYLASATAEERRELASALISEPPARYRQYPKVPGWAVWSSRLAAIPIGILISVAVSGKVGLSPFSRYSAFGSVAVALMLATLPNQLASQIGLGWAWRPPRTNPLPPVLALLAGWLFLLILVAFAFLLPDAA